MQNHLSLDFHFVKQKEYKLMRNLSQTTKTVNKTAMGNN